MLDSDDGIAIPKRTDASTEVGVSMVPIREAAIEPSAPPSIDPQLGKLIQHWAELSEAAKSGIRAMIAALLPDKHFVTPAAPSAPSRWEREARSNERVLITEDLGLHPHDYDVPFLDHWPTDFPCDVAVTLYSRTRRQRMWELHRGAGKHLMINGVWYGVKPK